MSINIFFMDGYGIYVWSSFLVTFFGCLFLYLNTKKTLNKLEKEFIEETQNLSSEQFERIKNQKIPKEILISHSKT